MARKPRVRLRSPARTKLSVVLRKWVFSRLKSLRVEKSQEKAPKRRAVPKPQVKKGLNVNLNIKIPGLSGRVKPKVLMVFTRQLATLVDAGLPLLRGLRVLEKQERSSALKSILRELALAIEGGSTFSEALAQHPKVFNRLFVNMVKAGELGGVLEVALRRLAEFSEKRRNQRQSQSRDVLSGCRDHCRGKGYSSCC